MKKMQRRGKVDVDAKKASGAAQLGTLPEGMIKNMLPSSKVEGIPAVASLPPGTPRKPQKESEEWGGWEEET